jgi:hypothetical protein
MKNTLLNSPHSCQNMKDVISAFERAPPDVQEQALGLVSEDAILLYQYLLHSPQALPVQSNAIYYTN